MADEGGFEPPVLFQVHMISNHKLATYERLGKGMMHYEKSLI